PPRCVVSQPRPAHSTNLARGRLTRYRRLNHMRRLLTTAALAGLILAAALPSAADARIYVRVGPPRAIVETRVVAPGPQHVWITGYHRWDGAAYVWVPGRWELPPRGR